MSLGLELDQAVNFFCVGKPGYFLILLIIFAIPSFPKFVFSNIQMLEMWRSLVVTQYVLASAHVLCTGNRCAAKHKNNECEHIHTYDVPNRNKHCLRHAL